ncbi:hypothetical protein AB0D45_31255 [Streptomyces sp. NPDC048352]|uniref:hypothetical protein n=1 Tax=Streptomyces sp. NPDC048352 TaxID=3154718 RepID=UPI00342ABB16
MPAPKPGPRRAIRHGRALQRAGARGAGGLLEHVGRGLDAVADQGRGLRGRDGQEVTEGCDIPGAFCLPGTAQQGGRFTDPVLGQRPVRRSDERGDATH